jgi:hypothetical protein
VNFFGHAVVAARSDPAPAFVLGAMLPDFSLMLRVRSPITEHPQLLRGIAFHHRTDEVFHGLPTFAALTQDARIWLSEHGLARGSARAIAHVGVEILLDITLRTDEAAVAVYRAALLAGSNQGLGGQLAWHGELDIDRWEGLRQLLLERSSQPPFVGADQLAQRLERALHGRPRLELAATDRPIVATWVDSARAGIAAAVPELIGQLWRGLSEPTAQASKSSG